MQVPNVSQMMQNAIDAGKQKLCGFARQQMRKATEPLTAALKLPSFQNLGIPGFTPQSTTIEFEEPQMGFGSERQGDSQSAPGAGHALARRAV